MCDETDTAVSAELPRLAEHVDQSARYPVIEGTFRRMLRRLAGETARDADAHVHQAFGSAAAYAGLSLVELTAGYRIGARVGWSHIRAIARDLNADTDLALLIAETQVAAYEEVIADSVTGYTQAARRVGDHHARERQSFVESLIAGRATAESAHAIGWTWPTELAVAVIHDGDPEPAPSTQILIGVADGAVIAVGAPTLVEQIVGHCTATIGPSVTPSTARQSFERARRLANLVATGSIARSGLVRWDDELATLIVRGAPDAAAQLASRRLDALRDKSPERERMLHDTLAAWLDHPGQPLAIARALHLHPQSVRYRLSRLRERLGHDLDDPTARFEYALALHYRFDARRA